MENTKRLPLRLAIVWLALAACGEAGVDPAAGRDPIPLARVVAEASVDAEPTLKLALRRTAEHLSELGVAVTGEELDEFREHHRKLGRLAVDENDLEERLAQMRVGLELLRDRHERPEEYPEILAEALREHRWLDEEQIEALSSSMPDPGQVREYLANLPTLEEAVESVLGGEARRTLLALGAVLGERLSGSGEGLVGRTPEELYLALAVSRRANVLVYVYRDLGARDAAFGLARSDPSVELERTEGLLHVFQLDFAPVSPRGILPAWLVPVLAAGEGPPQSVPGEVGGPDGGADLGLTTTGPAIAQVQTIQEREGVGALEEWEATLKWLPGADRSLRDFDVWLRSVLTEAGVDGPLPSVRLP